MHLTDTLYLDSLYNEVKFKSCAKYVRVITNYDSTNNRFNAIDFNTNGQKVFEGQLRFVNSGFPDGNYTYYFDNGKIRLKGKNKNIHTKGFEFEEELWHRNGIKQGNTSFNLEFKIHNHFDTLGGQDIKNGNGYCTFMSYYDNTIEKGQVLNGRKEGKWLVYDFNGKLISRENYNNGNLTKGYRIRSSIDSIQYKYYGSGDDVMITNKIEREIKKQIKELLPF
jgi:antitoxin component YwqK of YwqJK toxin-antitoxin module